MTVRLPDQIAIRALWSYDFPAVHEFYFPTISDTQIGCSVFTDNNILRIITNQKIYLYQIETSTSIADESMAFISHDILAYPNPVRSSQQLVIKTSSKGPSILDVYNIRGQKVQSLKLDKAGQIEWDLRDYDNIELPSGVYIIEPCDRNAGKLYKLVIIN